MSSRSTAKAAAIDLTPLDRQIGYHLRLANAVAVRSFNEALGALGLAPADYGALVMIERNPGLIQQDLATALALQRANLVRVLNTLEDRGLIKRAGNSLRENALYLTQAGKRMMPAVHAAHAAHEKRVAQALGRDPKSLLSDLRALCALDAG